MIATLAFRHLLVRKLRSLFLLLGFSLGVGVMIVLLSVGQAMLDQSRDVSLVGGGEVTVLPQGIDVEAMRTGGIGSMFFGVDRARFLVRQVFGGARHRNLIRTVSPTVEGKLLYLQRGSRVLPVRAGGEIPSRAVSVGSGLNLIAGSWKDSPADSAYLAPSRQQLYDELDRFHIPPIADSTWGEWHYFNIVPSQNEWWYITYLVGGEIPRDQHNPAAAGRWGGQLLVTHRRADGEYQRFLLREPSHRVRLDTTRADLMVGGSSVTQRSGVYHLIGGAPGSGGTVRIDVTLEPVPNRYFPPVELRSDEFVSGYVVPGLVARASGYHLRVWALPAIPSGSCLPRSQLGCLARCDLGVGRRAGKAPVAAVWRRIRAGAEPESNDRGPLSVFSHSGGFIGGQAGAALQRHPLRWIPSGAG